MASANEQRASDDQRGGRARQADHPLFVAVADASYEFEVAIPLPSHVMRAIAEQAARIALEQLRTMPDYMGTRDAASYLGWPMKRIDNLCAQNRIPFHKDGGRRIFIRQEIDEWVRELNGATLTQALSVAN